MSPRARRAAAGVAVIVGVAVAARSLGLSVADAMAWVSGPAGLAVYVALYTTAALLLLPGSALTALAGAVWGPIGGAAAAWGAALIASSAAFAVARFGLGPAAGGGGGALAAVDRAISGGGLRGVALLRLSPLVPFNLLNYALGASRVRYRDHLLGSALGMVPGTALFALAGSTAAEVGAAGSGGIDGARLALGVVGVVATAASAWWLGRAARRGLDDAPATRS